MATIIANYEAIVHENTALRTEIAALKQQIALQNIPSVQDDNTTQQENVPSAKKAQVPFWQTKQKIHINWKQIPIEFPDSVTAIHVSKDEMIAFGCADSSILLFSPSDPKLTYSVRGHNGMINCIVSNPNFGLYASCSGDGNVNIWSPQQSSPFQAMRKTPIVFQGETIVANTTLSNHSGPVYCASWINNDGHLVTGSKDCTICLWDVTHSANCIKSDEVKSSVLSFDSHSGASPNIAAGLYNGEIIMFDQRAPTSQTMSCNHGKCHIMQVKFTDQNGNQLLSGGSDKNLCMWDLRSPSEPISEIDIDRTPTKFSVCENIAVVPCELGHMRIVDLQTLSVQIVESNPFLYTISCSDFIDKKTKSFVAASWDGTAAIGNLSKS